MDDSRAVIEPRALAQRRPTWPQVSSPERVVRSMRLTALHSQAARSASVAALVSDPIDVDMPFSASELAAATSEASVAALGRSDRVPGRAGARPGDLLVVTGPLGGAGAAFRKGRLVRPPLRVEEGKRLARVATPRLALSDGRARDAGHERRAPGAPLSAHVGLHKTLIFAV